MTAVDTDAVLRAIAHPVRRGVLLALRDGPRTAGDLASRFDLAASTLSGHFSVLRHAGLIEGTRKGPTISYAIDEAVLAAVLESLSDDFGL